MTQSQDEVTVVCEVGRMARSDHVQEIMMSPGALGHQLSDTNTKASASAIEGYIVDSESIGDHAASQRTEHGLVAKKKT
ncbi:hypothetical protein BELL_0726g00010 [Botrytis elliptica]|uniref:Uncharacterized protein n=1 Tax=Botrytis elliptica TaxID=278938 RepID=A0A4Z1JM86_9HELO|nr:hypothetical protein BELL_0726g00010 [Botrytis elliptica]